MRYFLVITLSLSMLGAFDKPVEAGLFFRRGPLRRLFFGPVRRRMFGRMMRPGRCLGCVPRGFRNPRNFCGPRVHGGGCGFNRFNNFNNFNNFNRFNRDQFQPFFDPGLSNPFLNERNFVPDSFNDFRNRNIGGSFAPVSRLTEDPESNFQKQFKDGLQPSLENIRSNVWKGQCELENGQRGDFNLDLKDETLETVREGGLYFPQKANLAYMVRTNADATKLFVRVDTTESPKFCVLNRE